MINMPGLGCGLLLLIAVQSVASMAADKKQDAVVSVNHYVPHVSTVPANKGQNVRLYVRERVLASLERNAITGKVRPPVVLFVHGGFSPSAVAYDLAYKDYSWMAYLARAGFDVFAMTHTAYGTSPRPMMDDPCNVDPKQQTILIPHALKEPCLPSYPYKLVSSQTEWDEIETVVNYLSTIRGAKKVSMIGWSTGTPRIAGFAAKHPDRVDRIVWFAPAPYFQSDKPPATFPEPGAPVLLQTRERLEKERWLADVKCKDQIDDPKVRDVMWKELMEHDKVGATWMPGGVMRAPNRMNYGWRANVEKIKSPTLVLLGEFDNFDRRQDAWKGLKVDHKVFVKIACGSHFLQYEKNRKVLHQASLEWLKSGTVAGRKRGNLTADANGKIR